MRDEVIRKIKEEKLIAIVRGQSRETVLRLADAIRAGGIHFMEITYNASRPETDGETAETVAALRRAQGEGFFVGSGTVLSARQAELTREAGGQYIISPNVSAEVIRATVSGGMVSIPGAMTPTECQAAHESGADFVKLFPMVSLGAGYLRAVAAPLSHIDFLAVGGVNPENIGEYLRAGAVGFGIGGDLFPRDVIAAGRFDLVTERAKRYVEAVGR